MRTYKLLFYHAAILACMLPIGCDRPVADVPNKADQEDSPSTNTPLVIVTPEAAAVIKQITTEMQNEQTLYLRLSAVAGGCTGFQHKLDLDPQKNADDIEFESGGVKVVIAKRFAEFMRGVQVDYVKEGDRIGFKVHQPNRDARVDKWLTEMKKEMDMK